MSVWPFRAAANKGVNPWSFLIATLPPCARAAITPSLSPDAEELKSIASEEPENVPSVVILFGGLGFQALTKFCLS